MTQTPTKVTAKTFRYKNEGILWDSAKGLIGIILVSIPLIFGDPIPWISYLLLALMALFMLFIGRCYLRFYSEFQVDDEKLSILRPFTKTLKWQDITQLKLRYYSTKKTGDDGWMFLQLKAGNISINVDSQIDGFDDILKQAAKAAEQVQLALDPVTLDNMNASGINTPMERAKL